MAKRIAFFNHKGGVSKTTSVYNVGWKLAETKKVLLVDADPQCNLTSLLLGDDFERYYTEEATKSNNIKDGVDPAFTGRPHPIDALECYTSPRLKNLHLMPGHANLSEFDAALTLAQTSNNAIATLQNLPGAFSELIAKTEEEYCIDYTLVDLNPSLSAINQNLMLSTDGFVVPTNPDPFSIMAIDTLQKVLPRWSRWKDDAARVFAESAYPMYEGKPRFLGTIIQRFNIRKGKAARPYRNNIDEIRNKIREPFFREMQSSGLTLPDPCYPSALVNDDYCLMQIPDFQGLLPKSHDAGVPVFALSDAEIGEVGTVLGQFKNKRQEFDDAFTNLTASVKALADCG